MSITHPQGAADHNLRTTVIYVYYGIIVKKCLNSSRLLTNPGKILTNIFRNRLHTIVIQFRYP